MKLKKATPVLCEYVSKTPPRKIADFYRDRLTEAKWTAEPRFEIDGAIYGNFRKDGFLLRLAVLPAEEGASFVGIENMGTLFAAHLPRVPDASRAVEESPTEILYDTHSAPVESMEFYRKLLEPAGWKELQRTEARRGGEHVPRLSEECDGSGIRHRQAKRSGRVEADGGGVTGRGLKSLTPFLPEPTIVRYNAVRIAARSTNGYPE